MNRTLRLLRLVPIASFVALGAFFAHPALAQSTGVGFELTPFVAYRFEGNVTIGDAFESIFDEGVDIDKGESYGAILDIPLSHNLQLEFLGSRQSTQAVRRGGLFNPRVTVADLDVTYAHVGLAYNWRIGQVSPFIAGGVGATFLNPDLPGASDDTRASASLGGGLKIFLGEHVGIRLEGRGYWTDTENRSNNDCCQDEGGLFQGEAIAGLTFTW